jgi:hypothetical protein
MAGVVLPVPGLLRRRRLDVVSWSAGLPAFGPEALMVQLASRPGSFRAWADLVAHLDQLVGDCALDRLVALLEGQSSSAWQRAGYLLERGGRPEGGTQILDTRPSGPLSVAAFGSAVSGREPVWDSRYGIADRLVAPLQAGLGKA